MPIRALVFDLWGTLLYVDDPQQGESRRATRCRLTLEALRGVGHPYPEETVTVALQTLGREHGTLHGQGRDIAVPEKVERFLNYLKPNLAQRVSPSTLRAVEEALVAPGRMAPPFPAPGAIEALREAQARGLAVGLISNTGLTPGYVLREVLADHGLLSFFQVLTFSDEARLAKPAAEVFHCTLEALGVQPADALFVGDVPALDVAGPQAVGMWAVQVGDQQLDGVQPHACIDALSELFPALERLGLLAK
jgi:putative hydrolase of the HAD superfamily